METVQWHEKIKRQLEVVQQWRQSGKSIAAWAAAHGVDAKLLMGWVTYEKRWQQRLAGAPGPSDQSRPADPAASQAVLKTTAPTSVPARPKGFVAARRIDAQAVSKPAANTPHPSAVVQPSPTSVRVECALAGTGAGSGAVNLVLHWPLTQTQELATLLKSLSSHGNVSTDASTLGSTRP
jgi:transposase-like protein